MAALVLNLILSAVTPAAFGPPSNLRIEGLLEDVAVISEPNPKFNFVPSVVHNASARGVTQSALQVKVTSTATGAEYWDSGKVATDSTSLIYTGPALAPFAMYTWTVQLTLSNGATSALSAPSQFETGPISPADWQNASWLGSAGASAPNQFRFEFELSETAKWARVYVASGGCAAVLVNGKVPKVDLRGICPWVVNGNGAGQNVRYLTHDVTAAVTAGKNAVGIIAGNVMETTAQFIAVLAVMRYGSDEPLLFSTSSPGWEARGSAFYTTATAWNTLIDWRLEEPGWASPGFTPAAGSDWKPTTATLSNALPKRALQMPLSAVLGEVKPVKVERVPSADPAATPGMFDYLYTFPKNFVGTVKVKALPTATDGSSLSIQSGEWLESNGPTPPIPPPPRFPVACGKVAENSVLKLGGCPGGKPIVDVTFASFGTSSGSCETGFVANKNCDAAKSLAVVKAACVGKVSCSIDASNAIFGGDPCAGTKKWLSAEISCGSPVPCGTTDENTDLTLGGCPTGQVIAAVTFASFGTPGGSCAAGFTVNKECNAKTSAAVVKARCVGKASCTITADVSTFGGDPCLDVKKHLSVQVHCDTAVALLPVQPLSTPQRAVLLAQVDPLPPLPPVPANGTGVWPTTSGKVQTEIHILRSGNLADIETLFCWHGFQYVRVSSSGGATGFGGGLNDIVGLDIHTNMTSTGALTFGGDGVAGSGSEHAAAVLSGINSMTLQSQVTNVAAYIPTDCPTREKHGWMGDALDASEEVLFNFDALAMHTQFMQMIEDNQGTQGDVPVVIPAGTPQKTSCHDIAWTSAYPQIANMLHTYYGDERLVARHWPSLVLYQENLIENAANNPDGIAECDQFHDWLCGNAQSCCSGLPKGSKCPTSAEMASFNYVLGLRAMSTMAAVLGNASLAKRYNETAEVATEKFHTAFWNPTYNEYGGDVGAIQSLTTPALFINSPPAALFPKVLQTLENDLTTTTNYNPFIGAVTSKILLNVLSDNGLHETALKTATMTTAPSWGYWWARNSSTCWESWPLKEGHGSGTLNHIFLCGGIAEWMWKHLVGLTPTAPQFAEVALHPLVHPVEGPASVAGSFMSPRGLIASAWKLGASGVELNVSLPIGVQRATVVVPKPFQHSGDTAVSASGGGGSSTRSYNPVVTATVSEGGVEVWDGEKLVGARAGISAAADVGDGIAFEVTNGVFAFVSAAA